MPRLHRVVYVGQLVHVISRFVHRDFRITNAEVRREHLRRLGAQIGRFVWAPSAFVLLSACSDPACPEGRVETEDRACVCAEGTQDDGSGRCVRPSDVGNAPARVVARYPWNGFQTGSVHAPDSAAEFHPLRPKFMWEPVSEASHYELQLDDECGLATFRDCAFPSPEIDRRIDVGATSENDPVSFTLDESLEVSLNAPVGRRYFWRVRACNEDTCSGWTETRYLDVGRLGGDYNCDGYSDVLVGAPNAESEQMDGMNDKEGKVFVFFGGAAGVAASAPAGYENPLNQGSGFFGDEVSSVGDVNGDGCSDAVIGVSRQDLTVSNQGEVYLFLGSPSGLPDDASLNIQNPLEQSGAFGHAITSVGDLNGDGYGDFAVGANKQSNGADSEGAVYVFYGSEEGPANTPSVSLDSPGNLEEAEFGTSISTIGDINGDGYSDVVVGARGQNKEVEQAGAAFVYLGNAEGIGGTPAFELETDIQESAFFGDSATGGGDMNADGYADYAVGAFGYPVDGQVQAGAVEVYFGAADPTQPTRITLTLPNPTSIERFGQSISARGDLNGDGIFDLVASAPRRGIKADLTGEVYVFLGQKGEFPTTPNFTYPPSDDTDFSRGRSVSNAGDVNGDGYSDLVLSRPAFANTGRIDIYFGPLETNANTDQEIVNPNGVDDDQFGSSVY